MGAWEEIVRGRNVLIVDYSFPRAAHERLVQAARRLLVLDHHKTAYDAIGADTEHTVFDMSRSGATLAYAYFTGAPPPLLVQYVQDRDLWTWTLPSSREFSAALSLLLKEARDTTGGAVIACEFPVITRACNDVAGVIALGHTALRIQRAAVASVVANRRTDGTVVERVIDGERFVVVNTTHLMSELGEALALATPDARAVLLWRYDGAKREYVVSARSTPAYNCSTLATRYGGGGHPQSAGWRWCAKDRSIESYFDFHQPS